MRRLRILGPRAQLNLCLGVTFVVVFCITSGLLYRSLVDDAMNQVKLESLLRMRIALATRMYTINEVRPLLEAHGLGQELAAIPAHAAIDTMKILDTEQSDYHYREVAPVPLNPRNQATGWERDAIDAFRSDAGRTEVIHVERSPSGRVMHIARGLRATSDCLECHGAAAKLPDNIRQRYGSRHIDWHAGNIEAVQIVSVPIGPAMSRAHAAWWWHVGATVFSFGTLFAVLNAIVRRGVLAPIESSNAALRQLATKDPLTGALNRRSFDEHARKLVEQEQIAPPRLALVAVDIDHFKRVNDTFGHAAGDRVLKEFVGRILNSCKRRDLLFRIGGEEFMLLLPDTDENAGATFAESLRRALESEPFESVGGLTASFGVSSWQPNDTIDAMVRRADDALYAAKAAGRNRVVAGATECAVGDGASHESSAR